MKKRVRKVVKYALLIFVSLLVLFVLGTFIFHKIKTKQEFDFLKKRGYYNPVSVGEYSLNVSISTMSSSKHSLISTL